MTDRIAVYCMGELTSFFRDGISQIADKYSTPIDASYTADYCEFLHTISHNNRLKMLIVAVEGSKRDGDRIPGTRASAGCSAAVVLG